MSALAIPLLAYLLGSISFAWLAGRMRGIDLRQAGSRNLGATNAGRVLGSRWFLFVFVADLGKGLAPVLVVLHLLPVEARPLSSVLLAVLTGLGVVLGHVFTCFHGFRGGKAVATSLGVLIGLAPLVAAACFGLWLLIWLLGRGLGRSASQAVGPASVLAATAALPLHSLLSPDPWAGQLPITLLIAAIVLLIIIRHRRNIAELIGRHTVPASESPTP